MKRKSLAMAIALAMVLTVAPVHVVGAAEGDILMAEMAGEETMATAEMQVEATGEEISVAEVPVVDPEAGEQVTETAEIGDLTAEESVTEKTVVEEPVAEKPEEKKLDEKASTVENVLKEEDTVEITTEQLTISSESDFIEGVEVVEGELDRIMQLQAGEDSDEEENLTLKVTSYPVWQIYISPGESTRLSVQATSDLGEEAIKYQWYQGSELGEDLVIIPGNTGATYQTPVLTRSERYECHVVDGISEVVVYFLVTVDDYDLNLFKNAFVVDGNLISVTLSRLESDLSGGDAVCKYVPTKTAKYEFRSEEWVDGSRVPVDEFFCDENLATFPVEWNSFDNTHNCCFNMIAGKAYYLRLQNCGDRPCLYKASIHALCEHVPGSYISRTEATCTANGSFKAVCANCKEEYEDILYASGQHTYGGWRIVQAPTIFADGVEVRTCTGCGAQETRPIAKLASTMTLNVSSIPLKVGQSTTKVTVTGLAAGDSIAFWTSSNPKVVKVDASGKITAQKKAGGKKATVTVTLASGLSRSITVKVQKSAVKASKISVATKKLTLEKGAKYSVVPAITPITTLDKVSYSSSNKKVATVSKKGVITAKKSGKAKITVKCGSKKATITVTVPKTQPTGITNIPAVKTLKKGKSTTLKAKLTPSGAEAKITYKSSNKKVATVNAKGKVTAKKKGTAVITIKAGSIVTTCTVTVK